MAGLLDDIIVTAAGMPETLPKDYVSPFRRQMLAARGEVSPERQRAMDGADVAARAQAEIDMMNRARRAPPPTGVTVPLAPSPANVPVPRSVAPPPRKPETPVPGLAKEALQSGADYADEKSASNRQFGLFGNLVNNMFDSPVAGQITDELFKIFARPEFTQTGFGVTPLTAFSRASFAKQQADTAEVEKQQLEEERKAKASLDERRVSTAEAREERLSFVKKVPGSVPINKTTVAAVVGIIEANADLMKIAGTGNWFFDADTAQKRKLATRVLINAKQKGLTLQEAIQDIIGAPAQAPAAPAQAPAANATTTKTDAFINLKK
tara:strand:+ start:488 stop:1456 length:969 start_codon:yes stop_codon:yes gene_type:complete